jgi:hypothetical protein
LQYLYEDLSFIRNYPWIKENLQASPQMEYIAQRVVATVSGLIVALALISCDIVRIILSVTVLNRECVGFRIRIHIMT